MIHKYPIRTPGIYTQPVFGKRAHVSARRSQQSLPFMEGSSGAFLALRSTRLPPVSVSVTPHRSGGFAQAAARVRCSSRQQPIDFPIIPSLYVRPSTVDLCSSMIDGSDFAKWNMKKESITSATLMACYDYLAAECALEELATSIIDSRKRSEFKDKHAAAVAALYRLKESLVHWPTDKVGHFLDEIDRRSHLLQTAMCAIEDIDDLSKQPDYLPLKVFIYLNKEPCSVFEELWGAVLERLLIYYLILDALQDVYPSEYEAELHACIARIVQHTRNSPVHRTPSELTRRTLDASMVLLEKTDKAPNRSSVESPDLPSLYSDVPLIALLCGLLQTSAFSEFHVSDENSVSAALIAFYDYLEAERALSALAHGVADPVKRKDFKHKHADASNALCRLKSALEDGSLPEGDTTIDEINRRMQVLEHAMMALEHIHCLNHERNGFCLKVLISLNKEAHSIFESTWDASLERLLVHYWIVNGLYQAYPQVYQEELSTYIQRSLQHIEHRSLHRAWSSIARAALDASVVYFKGMQASLFLK